MLFGGPFLTYYDDTTGERTELSYPTFDNWVAKTANWLRDEHAAGPGSTVGVARPGHWRGVVLAFAAWRVGATVAAGTLDADDDVLIYADVVLEPHDLPDGPAESRRLLVTGDVLDAALAAYRGRGSIVFGRITDPARVAAEERAVAL